MHCLICNTESNYYFTKTYHEDPFSEMMREIGSIDYYKCSNCGFTLSKTHAELTPSVWEKLNYDFHHYIENNNWPGNQPPYNEQASMINILARNNMIDTGSMLDFAGGYGTLGKILKKYYGWNSFPIYDPYIHNEENKNDYVKQENLGKYKTVFNSALFEHLIDRKSFDQINELVADDGCMIIHTVICENIPKDPNWFYLVPPVHCAFHTNKSMEILMKQWGYKSSVYCPSGKSWILFRTENPDLQIKVDQINDEFQTKLFIFKNGFVDYWKGF